MSIRGRVVIAESYTPRGTRSQIEARASAGGEAGRSGRPGGSGRSGGVGAVDYLALTRELHQRRVSVSEKFTSIRKGLLEFLILRIIASDKVYVADMLKRLRSTEFSTQEGTLYPLLSKLRREGLVDYEWQESDAGPPRKYYELTAKGRVQLAELN